MIIVAIDRALDSRQLTRVARRAVFAMADVGSEFSPYSGDYAIAFATAQHPPVPESALARIFAAAAEATAEAILNSLFLATTTTGYQGHTQPHAVRTDVRSSGRTLGREVALLHRRLGRLPGRLLRAHSGRARRTAP